MVGMFDSYSRDFLGVTIDHICEKDKMHTGTNEGAKSCYDRLKTWRERGRHP